MAIEDDKNLHPLVSERLPEFVRVDHPTLVAFLSAYYEWLDLRRDSGLILSPMALKDVIDIDRTMDQFVDKFKQEYLFGFPETLAVDKETGKPVEPKNLLKNIKQFYRAKGTEKSYEFLFRIFFDAAVEFYYPKNDILKLSGGRWIQNNYLRVSNTIGDNIYRASGNTIVQKNSSGGTVAVAKVIDVSVYQKGNFTVAELLIEGRNGTFRAGSNPISFADGSDVFVEPKVYSVVSSVNILDGGVDYMVGDDVVFVAASGDSGQKARGTVREIDSLGGVRKITIDDFGINYELQPSVSIVSRTGTGFSGTVNIGALCEQAGYYAGSDGILSSSKVIQDNHYYQNWSYVLKSEIVIDRYREIIRKLVHPVGTAMFGQVQIKRCLREDIDTSISLMSYEIPLIGNYMPYTFYTFDDLGEWFTRERTRERNGYNPLVHDRLIQGEGEARGIIGNPVTNRIPFIGASAYIPDPSISGHTGPEHDYPPHPQNGESFWFVYNHPNTKITGSHIAKVWTDQIRDFSTWDEWILRGSGETAIYEWIEQAQALREKNLPDCCHGPTWRSHESFKYGMLKYTRNTEFRKITARAFFEMPTGDEFSCKEMKLGGAPVPTIQFDYPLQGETVLGGFLARERDKPYSDNSVYKGFQFIYEIKNPQNLSRYQIEKILVSLDNRQNRIAKIYGEEEIWFENLSDGRHSIRCVLLDKNGKEIRETEKSVSFYYQYLSIPQGYGILYDGIGATNTDEPFRTSPFVVGSGDDEKDTRTPIKTTPDIIYNNDTPVYDFNPDLPEAT